MERAIRSMTGARWRVELSEQDVAKVRRLIENAPAPSVAISDKGPTRQEESAQ